MFFGMREGSARKLLRYASDVVSGVVFDLQPQLTTPRADVRHRTMRKTGCCKRVFRRSIRTKILLQDEVARPSTPVYSQPVWMGGVGSMDS